MTVQTTATPIASKLSFEDLPFASFLKETIRTVGYTTPTPIQADSIPLILEGRDVIGLAQTGTGKTAAFVLPLLQKLSGSKEKGVRALILAPTRELAEQINDVIKTFSGRTGVRSVTVYGGVSHRNQISQLRTNVQIVVACPGRLMDHLRGRTVDLSGVEFLVLDEADRMLDMGFMPDIKAIISELPADRQTMLFSATMPDEIAQLSKSILSEPTTVKVKSEQSVALVTHSMYSVNQDAKSEQLSSWLRANTDALVVVFTKMKHTAKRLGERLSKDGIPSTSLHGNLSQAQRQKALQGFRDGRYKALVATDIAARGIDVEGITHVLNYDMPDTLEAYIHRTGRAGRASRQGDAISFVTRGDRGMVRDIEHWIKQPMVRLNSEQQSDNEGDSSNSRQRGRPARTSSRGNGRGPRSGSDRSPRSFRGDGERRERSSRTPRYDRDARTEAPQEERAPRAYGEKRDFRPRNTGNGDRPFRGSRQDDRGTVRPDRNASRERYDRDGASRPERSFNRTDAPRGRRMAGATDEGQTARRERTNLGRSGSSRFSDNSSRGPRPETRGTSDRTPRGGTRARAPRQGDSSFRGQRDIDQSADYVYRERGSHFIDRSSGDARRPSRAGKPQRGQKPRNNAR